MLGSMFIIVRVVHSQYYIEAKLLVVNGNPHYVGGLHHLTKSRICDSTAPLFGTCQSLEIDKLHTQS